MSTTEILEEVVEVNHVSRELSWLASAFATTGNFEMAKKLNGLSSTLKENAEKIRDSVMGMCNEMVKDAEQSSKTMLDALLVGMDIGEKGRVVK